MPERESLYTFSEKAALKLVELGPDFFCVLDSDGRYVEVNPPFLKALSYSAEQVLGRPFLDFVHPEDIPFSIAEWGENQNGLEARRFRNRYLNSEGKTLHIEWDATLDRENGLCYAVGRNITYQKEGGLTQGEIREYMEWVLRGMRDGLLLIDRDWTILYANKAAVKMLRSSPSELLGSSFRSLFNKDENDLSIQRYKEALRDNTPVYFEYFCAPLDIYVDIAAYPFKGGLMIFFRDISMRMEMLHKLQNSEAQHRELFQNNPQPMWIFDRNTLQILSVNQTAINHLGYTREQLLSMSILDFRPVEEIETLLAEVKKPCPERRISGPWRIRTGNGNEINLQIAWLDIDFEGRPARLALAHDLTETLKMKAEVKAAQERFSLVVRAISDVVWDWDIQEGKFWWSENFFRIFGYNPEEIPESIESWSQLIHPEDQQRVMDSFYTALHGNATLWREEYRFKYKSGHYARVEDHGLILRNHDGKPVRIVGGMKDVTEIRKIQSQYLRAQRLESIGTLAGGIAHDLNNLFAPIIMGVEYIKRRPFDQHSLEIIDNIHSSACRGADLVKQVLSFARGMEGQRVEVQISHLVREIQTIVRNTFPKNIVFETEICPELYTVTGDPTQFHQVLLNLCLNSRDAMPHGGTLKIKAANAPIESSNETLYHELKPGDYICIEVSDTGVGIDNNIIEHIFEPFFTTKEVGKGTGLGLSTAQGIVKSHGGCIHVYSEPGNGTTFRIYLPANRHTQAEPHHPEEELPRGRGECILLVDDETSILNITQQTLETFGYKVMTAENGAEAISTFAIHRKSIDLVLTDMMMPVMDGPSTIHALLKIEPNVRIVAASGLHANGGVAKAIHAGVKHFIPKPYTVKALLTVIRAALDENPTGA